MQFNKIENFRTTENKSQLNYFLKLIKNYKEFYEFNYGDDIELITKDKIYNLKHTA